jgi:hypothetical protein
MPAIENASITVSPAFLQRRAGIAVDHILKRGMDGQSVNVGPLHKVDTGVPLCSAIWVGAVAGRPGRTLMVEAIIMMLAGRTGRKNSRRRSQSLIDKLPKQAHTPYGRSFDRGHRGG